MNGLVLKRGFIFRYNMLVIADVHTHIFSPRIKENRERYVRADPCFASLYSDKRAVLATADELIESMDREEIDFSVVLNIGWTTPELCTETNDYIMESVARYPDRLAGFCAVQPLNTEETLKELERCIRGGIKGVGEMRPDTQGFDMNDAGIMDLFVDMLISNDLVFLTHASEPVGHEYQGKGSVTPEILYPFILKYPELKVVCAHWGGGLPFYCLMPEVKRAMNNVYFDTAASPYLYSPEIYNHVIRLAGADKILFGTDYPLLKPGRLLKEIDSLALTATDRQMILAENALRLLGIDQELRHG
jgi:predicted TIM-barrel fold metal-dependent hydrolase